MALPCNNLNLNLYRVFYTVAKTKSFSESSRVLHISQPAISKHIQNLEYELNTLLFYRTNRGIELTPEAKALYSYVEKAYNFLMLGEKELQESKELMKGKISLGIPTYIDLLHQHTLDMLIVPQTEQITKDLKKVTIFDDEYCFVYNKEKLEYPNISSLKELISKPLILPVKTTMKRKKLEEIFNSHGLTTNPIMELESNEMMLNYTKEGIGIGYCLKKVALANPELEIINLEEKLPDEKIIMVYNENTITSSTKEFIKLLNDKE